MSIGTLMSYTLVAACVIILRFRPNVALCVVGQDYGSVEEGETTTKLDISDEERPADLDDEISRSPYSRMKDAQEDDEEAESQPKPQVRTLSAGEVDAVDVGVGGQPLGRFEYSEKEDDSFGGVAVANHLERKAVTLVLLFVSLFIVASIFVVIASNNNNIIWCYVIGGVLAVASLIPAVWLVSGV